MMLPLLVLLFVFTTFAHENCEYVTHPELADLADLEKQLDGKAASEEINQ
jgi:hypothetical protein